MREGKKKIKPKNGIKSSEKKRKRKDSDLKMHLRPIKGNTSGVPKKTHDLYISGKEQKHRSKDEMMNKKFMI